MAVREVRRSLSFGVAATFAVAGLAGCVSEATYQEALRDARLARQEAAQQGLQIQKQQAQIDEIARLLRQREASSDKPSAAELTRVLHEISAALARDDRPSPSLPADTASLANGARPSPARKSPPLDASDPWTGVLRTMSPAGRSTPGKLARGRGLDALAARPLDDDDPWSPRSASGSSARATQRPPLDSDDPWRR